MAAYKNRRLSVRRVVFILCGGGHREGGGGLHLEVPPALGVSGAFNKIFTKYEIMC